MPYLPISKCDIITCGRPVVRRIGKLSAICMMACTMALSGAEQKSAPEPNVAFWLESSLKRVFPKTEPGAEGIQLLAARNSRIAFQACLKNRRLTELSAECQVIGADGLRPRIRYVGLVPMHHLTANTELSELDGVEHLPGLVPDTLWPLTRVTSIGPTESRSFWITLNIPADARPGIHEFKVRLSLADGSAQAELPVTLEVSSLTLKPRKDFPVTHWWRGEATWDYYKTGMFDERWWTLTEAQLRNMLDHGSDVVYAPIFFNRRETFKRPCQLLIVNETAPGKYQFDWSRVKRFTDLGKKIGFREFEWSHLWIYWGVKNPIRVYTEKAGEYEMLWPPDTGATSETYINFLKQFLPEFHDFLIRENILQHSYFHLSDEPGDNDVENYRAARKVLRELAPWMKVMDALSEVRYGREGLTDIPIPIVSAAQAYIDEKIPHWVYYCCAPQGPWLNRFQDTPLAKIRMSGMLFYRLGAKGFLHWGFNYWHKLEQEVLIDPFNDSSAAMWPLIPYGDAFMIYPGADGIPMDSLRWEVFAESLQDYALLQTAGIEPDDQLLAPIKSYAVFPKSEVWIKETLEKVLRSKPVVSARAENN
jgi:hypothetical protein